eukprot:Polyplicarium_translucidae@DN3226_c0_g2_i1.p1
MANPAHPPQAGQQQYVSASLYVGDLAPDVSEAMLYEVFHSVGPVASIRVCRDSVTRRSLGYAYVNYHSVADAERALDTLNYSTIKNQPCRIMWSHRDPALRKNNIGNVFVKNLDKSIDNKALYDTFSLFGNILSCKVATDENGRSLGYGFIHFESSEAARNAIERVNGMQIGTKTVFVGNFVRKTERQNTTDVVFTNVYAKNVPASWTDDMFKNAFEKFGSVTSSVLRQDNKGRSFGFVNFEEHEAAREAIDNLNGKRLLDDGTIGDDDGDREESPENTANSDANPRFFVGRAMTKAERVAVLKHRFSGGPERQAKHRGVNLYIKNLDETVDDEKLFEAFSHYGDVLSAKVMRDSGGQSRGFGFVCFETAEAATNAVAEMHLKLMMGKPLYVGLAEKREQRLARLQQRYRVPAMRPSNMPQMGYGTQVMYPQGPVAVSQQPRVMGYPPAGGMVPWRPPVGRPYPQHQQAGGVAPVPMYPQMNQATGQIRGGPGGVPSKQAQATGVPGGRMPHAPMGHHQQHGFKFTNEARNREGVAMPAGGSGVPAAAGQQGASSQPDRHAIMNATPHMQKQMIGERLFPRIHDFQPDLAGKITGMMLEMDNSELLMLLESDAQLKAKVDEALRVLHQARAQE